MDTADSENQELSFAAFDRSGAFSSAVAIALRIARRWGFCWVGSSILSETRAQIAHQSARVLPHRQRCAVC